MQQAMMVIAIVALLGAGAAMAHFHDKWKHMHYVYAVMALMMLLSFGTFFGLVVDNWLGIPTAQQQGFLISRSVWLLLGAVLGVIGYRTFR